MENMDQKSAKNQPNAPNLSAQKFGISMKKGFIGCPQSVYMIGLHCIDEILDQSKDYDWKLIEKKIVFAESNHASVQYGKILKG